VCNGIIKNDKIKVL